MNHFFPSVWFDCSLECFPMNLTSEARLTFSNTSIGSINHNRFNIREKGTSFPGQMGFQPDLLLRKKRKSWKSNFPKTPALRISGEGTDSQQMHLASQLCFLTRSFSSVLVDCLQSGCQTVEPGKTQCPQRVKGNGKKPELLRTFHILLSLSGGSVRAQVNYGPKWIMTALISRWVFLIQSELALERSQF